MKKARERVIAERCLAHLGYSAECIVECDRERPDMVAVLEGVRTGLEVTTVVEAKRRHATAPQQWMVETRRIVANAQRAFEVDSPTPWIVRLEFRPDWRPGAQRPPQLAADLAAAVSRAISNPSPWARPGEAIRARDPHPALSRLYVAPATGPSGGHWEPSLVGDVLPVSPVDIQETIRKKELELAAYRSAATAVWLLINCDVSGQGVALEAPEPLEVRTQFDGVFCTDFGLWRWVEMVRIGEGGGAA